MVEGLQRACRRRVCGRVTTAVGIAVAFFGVVAGTVCLESVPATAQVQAQPRSPGDSLRPGEPARVAPRPAAWRAGPSEAALGSLGERMNANTIAIVSGNLNATYLAIAYDLSAVLDEGDGFRILPIVGKGGGQNIRDVRFLKGVDLGITQANLLGLYQRTNEIGRIDDKICYLAKLFNEEMHVVVKAGTGLETLADLDGKTVNFSDVGSGSQLTARDVFARLGVKPVEVNMGQADAIEKLKKGEIAATVLIAGKPAPSMNRLGDGLRLLPVPFAKPLQADYLPAALSAEEYPGLIAPGTTIDTVAVGAVLFAYNWPKGSERYRRIENFIAHFFPRLADLQKPPRHPKWLETNLNATVPGWTRFPAAEEWLKRNAPVQASREQFEQFLAGRSAGPSGGAAVAPAERERLFQEFLRWHDTRGQR